MKTRGSTSFVINCDQNSCILVTCDNTYTMQSKDEMYLLIFFHTIPFVIYNQFITCDLSQATKRILIAKCFLRLKFSCKNQLQIRVFLLYTSYQPHHITSTNFKIWPQIAKNKSYNQGLKPIIFIHLERGGLFL